ncbi:MAG: response regulator [Candidatus Woesearchaeota archaeon]
MRKKRAVIYDDDISVLNVMKDIFTFKNYEVISLSIPKICPVHENEFISCPQEFPCTDILISDLNIEPIDGISLLLKQSKIGCKIDIRNKAIMSGNFTSEDTKKCIQNGITFFQKPFDFNYFFQWLENCEKRINLNIPLECRRTETRTVFNKEIIYVTAIDTKSKGFLINISNSGLCIKVNKPLFVNQIIKFKSNIPISCRNAIVRWVNKKSDNTYLAGMLCL